MSDTKYVLSDGVVLRMDNPERRRLSIYRGSGRWAAWLGFQDWLDGTPLSSADALQCMKEFDKPK